MGDIALKKRSEVPAEYKWKLEDMFETDEQWEKEVEQTLLLIDEVSQFKGHLADNEIKFLKFLELEDRINYHLARIIVYSNQRSHEDTAVSKYQAYASRAESVMVKAASALSFADPEILAMSEENIEEFCKAESKLLHYKWAIEKIRRKKTHTLSQAEENILAQVKEVTSAPDNIFSMFNNADVKFPYITDVEGNKIRITHGNFIDFLMSKDRSLRKQVFREVYGTYKKWGNTISATYISQIKNDQFLANVRKYGSAREMYLSKGNIPQSVYDNLIETVHAHLPALHEYMSLRKKMLGVEHLHMYDLFVPIVSDVDMKYSFEEAKDTVARALLPMGEEYTSILEDGMESGWIDVYENENKRSGAYSWGAYGTHPYVLLNYNYQLGDVSTLAHEMGHSIHSYYSRKEQSYYYAGYTLFCAEVASTTNEALLIHHLINTEKDKKRRLYLINQELEQIRTTVFRQMMFAEFELWTHESFEQGMALTAKDYNEKWHELNVKYFGEDMIVDEDIDVEWSWIPHFFSDFYVYQYATGYAAASAFAKNILEGKENAVEKYVGFLKSGGSDYPIEILKKAGVDMTTSEPLQATIDRFNELLEMLEKEI